MGTVAIRRSDEGLVRVLSMPLTPLVLRGLLLSGGLGFAATHHGRFLLALGHLAVEDGTNCFLAGGEVGGDIKQHVRTGGTASRELMHQSLARRALEEGIDDPDVSDAGELSALLGEVSDVVAQGFVGLLLAPSEIPGIPRARVGGLEVAYEDLDQVAPIVDLVRGEVLEP